MLGMNFVFFTLLLSFQHNAYEISLLSFALIVFLCFVCHVSRCSPKHHAMFSNGVTKKSARRHARCLGLQIDVSLFNISKNFFKSSWHNRCRLTLVHNVDFLCFLTICLHKTKGKRLKKDER